MVLSTVMASMHSALNCRHLTVFTFSTLIQGLQLKSANNTRCFSPLGPYKIGVSGPKKETVGVPIAAAICSGPLSTVISRFALSKRADSSNRSSWPAQFRILFGSSNGGGVGCFRFSYVEEFDRMVDIRWRGGVSIGPASGESGGMMWLVKLAAGELVL